MTKRLLAVVCLLLQLSLSGCATLYALNDISHPLDRKGEIRPEKPVVYGGTRLWYRHFAESSPNDPISSLQFALFWIPPIGYVIYGLVVVIDPPLSLLADTVLLPLTVPLALTSSPNTD